MVNLKITRRRITITNKLFLRSDVYIVLSGNVDTKIKQIGLYKRQNRIVARARYLKMFANFAGLADSFVPAATPSGPSFVRSVTDPMLRKIILASGRPAHPASVIDTPLAADRQTAADKQLVQAGRELLLECLTQDLGQPRTNIWLWFKNGHSIESLPFQPSQPTQTSKAPTTNPSNSENLASPRIGSGSSDFIPQDNPISGRLSPRTPTSSAQTTAVLVSHNIIGRSNHEPTSSSDEIVEHASANRIQPTARLLASGRYLFLPSIQLAHRGNYSCVAVNRLGSGPPGPNQSSNERDSYYQLRVALAPSFVQPLATRTYWSEVTQIVPTTGHTSATLTAADQPDNQQLELVCHVQCEPICQIEWLRNDEPLELKRQSEGIGSNYVSHQVKQTILDENEETNMFKSIESRLVFQFHEITSLASDHHQRQTAQQRKLLMDRDRVLERRHLLNGSNYTCQSSANSMGPSVRSTTTFIVQCEYLSLLQ